MTAAKVHSRPDCIFCRIVAGQAPASTVFEDGRVLAFMDRSPVRRGHVLVIPDFGTVSLGEVTVGERWDDPKDTRPSNYFELTVIKMNLGCVGTGTVAAGTTAVNGTHKP